MKLRAYKRIALSLAFGGLLLLGLILLLNDTSQIILAAPEELFVMSGGSGDCSQASPCDLPSALIQAGDGDSIYVAEGTYTGAGGAVITVTQSISLYGGWDGTTTMPVVLDPEMYPTTLDGEDARRVLYIVGAIFPTVEGFIITRGNANTASYLAGNGGGIFSEVASPIIRNNTIVSNTASISPTSGRGGGIYLYGASDSAFIQGNRVLFNTAHSDSWSHGGGGLYLSESDATVQDNLIQGNTCSRAGGGIYIGYGAPRILGNEIRSNVSDGNGGGIYSRFGSRSYIEGNLIVNNTARAYGGGVIFIAAQPTVVANRVLSNTARSGAGVSMATNSYYTVTNNFIARNDNGGIKIWESTRYGLVAHNTVVLNGGSEGGIYLAYGYITPTVVSNIVVSNVYGIRAQTQASGTLDYNDVWGNTTQDYDLPGALEPGPHDIQADPLFLDPGGNDFHLRAGSPCIDAAIDAGVSFDIDGDARPLGAGYDIGADEVLWQSLYLPLVGKNYP